MKNNRKIIIVGKAASGKNYVVERMINSVCHDFKLAVYDTTRPIRDGEEDGHDYYFLSRFQMFISSLIQNYVIRTRFNNWRYNLSESMFSWSNLIICSPEGLVQLLEYNIKDDLYIVYIYEDEKIRRERLIQRNSPDSTERRIKSDKESFNMLFELGILPDMAAKSDQYGRVIANSRKFLETGERFLK